MRRHLIALTLITAGCEPQSESDELKHITLAEPVSAPTLVREARAATAGGADLFRPGRVRWLEGSVWVLDAGNDRLVRFDSTLSRATTFGRAGEGPGELEFAMDLIADGERLVVAETGNGRLSIFDREGAFQRTIPSTGIPKYVAAVDGELFTAPGSNDHYAVRVDGGEAHAAVPDAVKRLARSDPDAYPRADPYLASAVSGPIYVLDPSVLAVAAYDGSGRLLKLLLLPEPFRSRLLDRRHEEMAAWGERAASFVSVPATKQISVDDRGRLLVPFSLEDHWGILIDPKTWTARALPLPNEAHARQVLWSASDAMLHGDRLYVVSDHRLYQFDATGWS